MATNRWISTSSGDYTLAANWSLGAAPIATNDVRIPAGTASITSNLNASAVALNSFIVEEGYTGTIGVATTANPTYLQIATSRFEFAGTGAAYIDVGSSAIPVQVFATQTPSSGNHGLYLKGSALTTLQVYAGDVGLAVFAGETSAVTTARTVGSSAALYLGAGVTTPTLIACLKGTLVQRCASTTTTVYGGTWTSRETGTIGTLNVYGGTAYPESTGTITTFLSQGGTTDFTRSGAARTVTTAKHNPGGTLKYDPASLTITNRSAPDFAVSFSASLAA